MNLLKIGVGLMKLIKYFIILCTGLVIGVFIGCTISVQPSTGTFCREYKTVDWYNGSPRYTYVPEFNRCYKR